MLKGTKEWLRGRNATWDAALVLNILRSASVEIINIQIGRKG